MTDLLEYVLMSSYFYFFSRFFVQIAGVSTHLYTALARFAVRHIPRNSQQFGTHRHRHEQRSDRRIRCAELLSIVRQRWQNCSHGGCPALQSNFSLTNFRERLHSCRREASMHLTYDAIVFFCYFLRLLPK